MPVIYVRGVLPDNWLNPDLGAKAREIQHPCRTSACSLTGCGDSYFVNVGLMARIRVDRRGRALTCEVIGVEKSLSLNFSRQGFQFPIRDRTSSGSEAYSCREDYIQDSSQKSSLEFKSSKRIQTSNPFNVGGLGMFKV